MCSDRCYNSWPFLLSLYPSVATRQNSLPDFSFRRHRGVPHVAPQSFFSGLLVVRQHGSPITRIDHLHWAPVDDVGKVPMLHCQSAASLAGFGLWLWRELDRDQSRFLSGLPSLVMSPVLPTTGWSLQVWVLGLVLLEVEAGWVHPHSHALFQACRRSCNSMLLATEPIPSWGPWEGWHLSLWEGVQVACDQTILWNGDQTDSHGISSHQIQLPTFPYQVVSSCVLLEPEILMQRPLAFFVHLPSCVTRQHELRMVKHHMPEPLPCVRVVMRQHMHSQMLAASLHPERTSLAPSPRSISSFSATTCRGGREYLISAGGTCHNSSQALETTWAATHLWVLGRLWLLESFRLWVGDPWLKSCVQGIPPTPAWRSICCVSVSDLHAPIVPTLPQGSWGALPQSSHQDIVNIDTYLWNPLQEVFHGPLEDGGCSGHTKWQTVVCVETFVGVNGRIASWALIERKLLVSMR